MNSAPDQSESLAIGERLIDAALCEHARVGHDGCDDELVHRILRETVARPSFARPLYEPATDWNLWRTVGLSVAALVGLLLLVLTSLEVGQNARRSDEVRFVIRLAEAPVDTIRSPEVPAPWLDGTRYSFSKDLDSLVGVIAPAPAPGSSPTFAFDSLELAPTMTNHGMGSTPFGPTFENLPKPSPSSRQDKLRITADRSESVSGRIVYTGNVVVEHLLFRIDSKEASVPAPDLPPSDSVLPLLARGVKVTQFSTQRTVRAQELRFDPVSGDLTLTGVEFLETSGGKLSQFSPEDRLILHREGFTVESQAAMRYASPPLRLP